MIKYYTGLDLDYIVIGMAVLIFILMIIIIINVVQNRKLKKKYKAFLMGKNGESLEDTLIRRISQVDEVLISNKEHKENIDKIFKTLNFTFQKIGLVKYDAFHEMGGKLSFSLALLNKENDGFIINAMHSRGGCYTYIKEIVKGNSFIILAEEEKEALEIAMENNKPNESED